MYLHSPDDFYEIVVMIDADGEESVSTPFDEIQELLWLNEGEASLACRIVAYELSLRPDLSQTVREALARDLNSELLLVHDRADLIARVLDNIMAVGASVQARNGFHSDHAGAYAVWFPTPLPY
jgi:hypothetical protein